MISINDIRTIVLANIPIAPVKGGRMYRDGTRYGEDAVKFSVVYDGNMVPYIAPQEYGFTHYLSGKFVTVNQGFIRDNTVNDLNLMINTANSSERATIKKRYERKNQVRDGLVGQGSLHTIKGNENR
jgi:hypothetical protein